MTRSNTFSSGANRNQLSKSETCLNGWQNPQQTGDACQLEANTVQESINKVVNISSCKALQECADLLDQIHGWKSCANGRCACRTLAIGILQPYCSCRSVTDAVSLIALAKVCTGRFRQPGWDMKVQEVWSACALVFLKWWCRAAVMTYQTQPLCTSPIAALPLYQEGRPAGLSYV